MNIAIQEDAAESHRAEVLADVRRALEAVVSADGGADGRDCALRDLHTVKGAVGFLGLGDLAAALHDLEDVLGRSGAERDVARHVADARRMLDATDGSGTPAAAGRPAEDSVSQCLWWAGRMIEQISASLGKEADLFVSGGGLRVGDQRRAPLTRALQHLVRNAIVHGVEPPHRRIELGKARRGVISVTASRADDRMIVAVTDDGAGLPESLSAQIFQPGVSGAADVSLYAGRGIGLDVVLSEAASLGGRVEVRSAPDAGACFTLTMPETPGRRTRG